MMTEVDQQLADEQRQFVEALRDFAARELSPQRLRVVTEDFTELHSDEIAGRLADLGWWGVMIEEEYGGSGASFVDETLLLEEAARAEMPIAAYAVTLIVTGALRRFGTHAQKEDLLRRVARGGVLAIAMSEAEAGSDVASLTTKARRDGDGWVIDGTKLWISWAHRASHILVVCRTDPASERHEGLSMLLVPREAPGLTITPIPTLGGDHTNELHFDGVRIPEDALLGAEGDGWRQLMAGLNAERVIIAAQSLGMAQRAFDAALAFVKERHQFGRPVGTFQVQQHRFADLVTELTQARLLVRWASEAVERDPGSAARESSMAKLVCTELAKKAALEGMQAMGGYGYASEYPMERLVREAVVTTIYGGTSEIQRNVIARTLGL
jgi:alkylation response protein AidB-like acyl-CoA dehydrogenase